MKATRTGHRCDSRCYYARGTVCRCGCGGTMHGRGNAEEWADDDRPDLDDGTKPRRTRLVHHHQAAPIHAARHQRVSALQMALPLY